VISQFAAAWSLDYVGEAATTVLTVHRSLGIVTWVVVVGRLIWRHNFAHLPAFPASMPKLQQTIAKLNEYGLYTLLLIQPLTGLADTLFRGHPFDLFFWAAPKVFDKNKALSHALHSVHEFGAWALLALIGMHAGAALFHGLILRDGVLQRMLPWTGKDPAEGGASAGNQTATE
jgi:cytochrome b561